MNINTDYYFGGSALYFNTGNFEVKVIADSVSEAGKRITTLQLKYPRFIHQEFMTHRVFSRNAASSRAIPVKKVLNQVWNNPAMPIHWGKNQSGMQAKEELTGFKLWLAKKIWRGAGKVACVFAFFATKLGLHKQIANRILEPWQFMHTIVTSTEWDNFFELRDHEDAQPEFQRLARLIKNAMADSVPRVLKDDDWHLPYTSQDEEDELTLDELCKVSSARCCRVSYLTHDGKVPSIEKDLALCERLAGAEPIHASPFEHQATPDTKTKAGNWRNPHLHGNLVGWIQHRKLIEQRFKGDTV